MSEPKKRKISRRDSVKVSISLPTWILQHLDKLAKKTGKGRSGVILDAVREYYSINRGDEGFIDLSCTTAKAVRTSTAKTSLTR